MATKHVRICTHCNVYRYAPCASVCHIPTDIDPENWELNPHAADADGVVSRS